MINDKSSSSHQFQVSQSEQPAQRAAGPLCSCCCFWNNQFLKIINIIVIIFIIFIIIILSPALHSYSTVPISNCLRFSPRAAKIINNGWFTIRMMITIFGGLSCQDDQYLITRLIFQEKIWGHLRNLRAVKSINIWWLGRWWSKWWWYC